MPSIKSALPLIALLTLAAPALAQTLPVTEENGRLVLSAQQQRLELPMPDWIDTAEGAWSELVSPRFTDIGNQAHLEIYPRGEGAAFWSTIYGAQLTALPDPKLPQFRALVMDVYAHSCRPDALAFFQLEADDGENIPPLGFVCGSYADPQVADEGEVTIMSFLKSENGVATIYQGWRGAAFDTTRPETWPVSSDEVEAHVARFKTEVALSGAD